MKTVIVDASVCVKWFVPETHWQPASSLLHEDYDLHAPDLVFAEVGNVVWKKTLREEITAIEAQDIVAGLRRVPLVVHTTESLLDHAIAIALHARRSVYDCVYVALACRLEARMATCDQRLLNALQGTAYAPHVAWIGDPREFPTSA